MARYIDADKTLDMMWNVLYQYEDDMEKKNGLNLTERLYVQNGFEIAHKVVVDAPAEDVAPVIHAHWITTKLSTKWTFRCSNCNSFSYESTEGSDIQWKYCPDCRATMDEKVDNG